MFDEAVIAYDELVLVLSVSALKFCYHLFQKIKIFKSVFGLSRKVIQTRPSEDNSYQYSKVISCLQRVVLTLILRTGARPHV